MTRSLASALALTVALSLAGSASAATVRMDRVVEEEEYVFGNIVLTAAAGEVNTLTVENFPAPVGETDAVVLRDATSPLTAGERCHQVDGNTVRCEDPDVPRIVNVAASLGDMDDEATSTELDQRFAYLAFRGGEGDDELSGSWARLEGGPGDDTLTGMAGRDDLQGEEGNDVLAGNGEIDYLDGGPGDDVMRGGDGHDSLYAGGSFGEPGSAGRDALDGGPGHDTLSDEDGLDTTPEIGPDVLVGGGGSDSVESYRLRAAPIHVDLRVTTGQGQPGENDVLDGIENVTGGSEDDVLIGNDAPNYMDGDLGQDVLRAGAGDDRLISMVNPGVMRQNRVAHLYGPDRVYAGAGDDLIETLPTVESRIACGAGDDRIQFEGFASEGDKAHSSVGPLVSRHCERLSMNGSPRLRTGAVIDPSPVRVTRDRLVFSFFAVRCCEHFLEVQRVRRPVRQLGTARVRRKRVSVRVGRTVVRRSRERPVRLRGKVTRVAVNRFVWRFEVGRGAF